MIKLYKRIFLIFILFIVLINVLSFLAGFNFRQLHNFFFYDSRSYASYYFIKNIALESGFYISYADPVKIYETVVKASNDYGIDSDVLNKLVVDKNEFSIGLIGGMGLTSISPKQFASSPYKDPFKYEDNIRAAAYTLKNLSESGVSDNELLRTFLLAGRDIDTLKVLSASYYNFLVLF